MHRGVEGCDDGNMATGDRCTPTCTLEFDTAEAAEPNDTAPQAITTTNQLIKGSLATTNASGASPT